VYFKQRIGDMTIKIAKLLHLDQVDQYRTTNGGFNWKLIETKLKADKDEGKLGERDNKRSFFPSLSLFYFLQKLLGLLVWKPSMPLLNMNK
jgi:hypothetical protein